MAGIEHLLLTVVGAGMTSDLARAVQQPDGDIGSHQRERPADSLRRDGVIVQIEADVDRLAGAHGFDPVGVEAMDGQGD